jgi:hypothetical protein
LNDNGILVGESGTDGAVLGSSGNSGLLYDTNNGRLYNINNYLPAGSPFTQVTALYDINDSNEFVGEGLVGGVEHGFARALDPCPVGLRRDCIVRLRLATAGTRPAPRGIGAELSTLPLRRELRGHHT